MNRTDKRFLGLAMGNIVVWGGLIFLTHTSSDAPAAKPGIIIERPVAHLPVATEQEWVVPILDTKTTIEAESMAILLRQHGFLCVTVAAWGIDLQGNQRIGCYTDQGPRHYQIGKDGETVGTD